MDQPHINFIKMRIVAIIQARMRSTRLPGKSMICLAGKPLLQHVFDRVKKAKNVDEIVLAASDDPLNILLLDLAKKCGVKAFVGSEDDLVERYYRAALQFKADYVVRIPADNPVIHGSEIDRIIKYSIENKLEFGSNIQPIYNNGYPDGIGAEVYLMETLIRLQKETLCPRNREHPHTYIHDNPDKFKVGSCKCPKEFLRPDIVLDINTPEDYLFMNALLVETIDCPQPLHIIDIIKWYDKNAWRFGRRNKTV